MPANDHGADLRPVTPTIRTVLERHLGGDLWRHASYLDGMLQAAEREQAFHEAANGRHPPVETAPVERKPDRAA
jgi:hypothetical protein